jgi:hypothetical protein
MVCRMSLCKPQLLFAAVTGDEERGRRFGFLYLGRVDSVPFVHIALIF